MSTTLNDSQESLEPSYSFDCFNVARTPRERKTFIVGGTLIGTVVLGLMAAVVVLAVHSGTEGSETSAITCKLPPPAPTATVTTCNATIPPQTTCTSSDCNLQAAEILYNLNLKADPCEDFFKYACGRWLEEDVVRTPPFDRDSSFNELQLKIYKRVRDILSDRPSDAQPAMLKAFDAYDACMKRDEEQLNATIWNITSELGGWPMLDGLEWVSEHNVPTLEKLFATLAKFRQVNSIGVLFILNASPDFTNTAQQVPTFDQPALLFQSNRSTEDDKDIFDLFWQIISQINPSANKSVVRQDTEDLLSLNDVIFRALATQDPTKFDYIALTIEEFLEMTDSEVDWVKYLKDIFKNAKKPFTKTTKVGVMSLNYFQKIMPYLKQYNATVGRAIINYDILLMLRSTGLIGSNLFIKAKRPFFQQLTNSQPEVTSPQRWFCCVASVSKWFSAVITPEYNTRYINASEIVSVSDEITTYIIKTFRENVMGLTWLDDSTKRAAIQKVNQIKKNYNFPNWALDNVKVNDFYKKFVVSNSSHLQNSFESTKFLTNRNYDQIDGIGPDSMLWLFDPLITNAFYNPQDNSINILQGMMQPPIFGADRLKVMNFGALGMVIAHEITHGFDTTGRQFDGQGNLKKWMDSSAEENFNKRAKCFIDQYSAYSLTTQDLPGYDGQSIKINGLQTLGENIADGGGIQNAYRAYKMWERENGPENLPQVLRKQFSHDQLFFLSFANTWCTKYAYGAPNIAQIIAQDAHSPPPIRIFGALSNSAEFSKAFHCSRTAAMVPSERCVLW